MSGYSLVLDFGGRTEVFERVEVVLAEVLDFFELFPSPRSISVALSPRSIDWPAAVLDGWDPSDASARVYRDGRLVLAGSASGPCRWGPAGSTVRLTIVEDPWLDDAVIPSAWDQRTTIVNDAALDILAQPFEVKPDVPGFSQGTATWNPVDLRGNPDTPAVVARQGLSLTTDRVVGRWGPWVFGAPGYQDGESWPATPAYWVDTTDGSERLLIARHRVAAPQVTIYGRCNDGEVRPKVLTVEHVRDAFGVEVATVDVAPAFAANERIITIVFTHAGGVEYSALLTFSDTRSGNGRVRTIVALPFAGGADLAAATTAWLAALNTILGTPGRAVIASPVAGTVTITPERGVEVTPVQLTASAGAGVGFTVGTTGPDPTDFAIDLTADWYVAWTHGEALPGGAGDVIRLVLGQTRARVDGVGLAAETRRLNRYRLAGYIDEPVGAVEWLVAQLAPLPIGWILGADGLRAWLYDPDAVPVHALVDALDGGDLEVAGDAGETARDPVSTVAISYRHRDDTAARQLVTAPRSLYRLEAARSGDPLELSTDVIDEASTADLAASLRLRALHRRHLTISGHLPRRDIRAGDRVRVDVPRLGVRGVGWVVLVEDDGSDRLLVELAIEQGGVSTPAAAEAPCFVATIPFAPEDIGWHLWYDALDAATLTLGGDGLLAMANKGTMGAAGNVTSGNVSGVARTAWTVAGDAVQLPGPFAVALPSRNLQMTPSSVPYAGSWTMWALVPITPAGAGSSHVLFSLRNGDVNEALNIRMGSASEIEIGVESSGFPPAGGVTIVETATGIMSTIGVVSGNYLILIARCDGARAKIDSWWQRAADAPVAGAPIDVASVLGTPDPGPTRVAVGGRYTITQTWGGLVDTVAYVDRALTDAEVLDLATWSAARLGWSGLPT